MHKKKKIFPFVKPWMNLKDIMLTEVSQTEKDDLWDPRDLTHMWNLKTKLKRNQSHRRREEIVIVSGGHEWVSGTGEGSQKTQTSSYKMKQSSDVMYSTAIIGSNAALHIWERQD